MANLALGFVLIAGLLAAPAYAVYSNEHLEVVDVEEVADDEGRITFVGNVMNANEYQSINPAQVFLTLKKEGIVIEVRLGRLASFDPILPSEIRSFSVESGAIQGDYDDFSIRVVGYIGPTDPNLSSLTGGLLLVEDSLNFTTIGPDSTSAILGELFNGTNAILTNIVIQFRLFKDEDCLIGTAKPSEKYNDAGSLLYQDLLPGEAITFIAYSDALFEKAARWEYDVGFDLVRIVPEAVQIEDAVPTAVTGATWGQIKQNSLSPAPRRTQ